MLRNEPFIRYERSVLGGQLADRYLRDHQIHPHQRLEIDGLLAIAALVDQGIGVLLLPDWVSLWSSGMSLARLPLPGRTPVRPARVQRYGTGQLALGGRAVNSGCVQETCHSNLDRCKSGRNGWFALSLQNRS
ncbi:LysR family transcriptional regulator [Caballeronia udeis]|uniref:LysR family transcriptional regulator n=1 Tax=Caballeronia udeis TaxID=1232866 RepID=A0A158FW90_9BURK|nr:LysR family transcriptional regulator [Caballeronia udeis]